MSRKDIIALLDRRRDAFARRDAAASAVLYAETCVLVSPTAGGTVTGRAAIEQVYQAWFKAFPDVVFISEEVLIADDRVVEIGTTAGTDTGGFMGLMPTAKPFRLPIVFLSTVKDREIVHERRIYDFTGMLVQIGVLKAKPA